MSVSWRGLLQILVLIFLCLRGIAGAQTDSGTILQQQRQTAPGVPDRLPDSVTENEVQPEMEDTGVRILVKGFRFAGSYEGMATDAELQKLVQGSIGHELGFGQLQKLAARVTNYLRAKKGFLLARAYLPKQDVTDGIIRIAILAGRVDGKARVVLDERGRINARVLQGIADRAMPEGSPLRMDQIERAALLMNDLAGIAAGASLEPGAAAGTTKVIIRATEGRFLHGALSADNFGDRYTGMARGMGKLSLYSPAGRGDELSFSVIGAARMIHTQAAYTVPLGSGGWTGNIAYSHLYYKIGEEMAPLEAKGGADTLSGGLSYPLRRTRKTSLWTTMGADYLRLNDRTLGEKTRDRRLLVGQFSLEGSAYDGLGGGGVSSLNLSLYAGNVNLNALKSDRISDAAGPRTHGGFSRAAYMLARLQRVTRALALFGSVRGQFASGNLDSSQKFILGGPAGIRAYPIGEAAGAGGHAVTLETRLNIRTPSWMTTQLVGFFDTGMVQLYRDVWPGAITNATGSNKYWLSGGGIGLNISRAGMYSLQASYARRTGDNPGRSFSGKDVDNCADRNRFWLQLLVTI